MDIASLINPTIISSAAGVVLAGVVVLVSVLFHKQIGAAVKSGVTGFGAWVKVYILNWKAFFWFVNIVCMVFSSQNAGYFFGLYEPVGIALAFVLDLMIIAFMQAMLTARMRGDIIRVRLIIFFIALCASLSTIGNLAHNLHVQQDIASRISHVWFGDWAPYIASCVPLLLVLLALVADIATKKSAEDMDLAEFEAEEKRQVEMLEIRNTYLQRRKEADYRSQLLQGKRPGSFRYPWEHRITNQEIIDQINEQNKTKEDAAKKAFDAQFATLQKRAKELEAEQFLTIQNLAKEAELKQAEQVAIEQAKHEQTLNYLIGQISDLTTLLDSVKMERDTGELEALKTGFTGGQNQSQSDDIDEGIVPAGTPAKIIFTEEYKSLLKAYPNAKRWLSPGKVSVTIEEIIEVTGQTRKMVQNRINDKTIKRTPRNENRYLLDTVLKWLLNAPVPVTKDLHIVPDMTTQNDVLEAS